MYLHTPRIVLALSLLLAIHILAHRITSFEELFTSIDSGKLRSSNHKHLYFGRRNNDLYYLRPDHTLHERNSFEQDMHMTVYNNRQALQFNHVPRTITYSNARLLVIEDDQANGEISRLEVPNSPANVRVVGGMSKKAFLIYEQTKEILGLVDPVVRMRFCGDLHYITRLRNICKTVENHLFEAF